MDRRHIVPVVCAVIALYPACGPGHGTPSDGVAPDTDGETTEDGDDDGDADKCPGATLELGSVCYRSYSLPVPGYGYVLDVDGLPGEEVVISHEGELQVYRFENGSFKLIASVPGAHPEALSYSVAVGDFDSVPGRDLIVPTHEPHAVTLYHIGADVSLTHASTFYFPEEYKGPSLIGAAVLGPDENGRSMLLGLADPYATGEYDPQNPRAIWRLEGGAWTFWSPSQPGACFLEASTVGDFDGNGSVDAFVRFSASDYESWCNYIDGADYTSGVFLTGGGFSDSYVHTMHTTPPIRHFHVYDIEGDGPAEGIIEYILNNTIGIVKHDQGQFPESPTDELTFTFDGEATYWRVIAITDLDNDGQVDLMLINSFNVLAISNPFSNPQVISGVVLDNFQLPDGTNLPSESNDVTMDLNGDGIADVQAYLVFLVSEAIP